MASHGENPPGEQRRYLTIEDVFNLYPLKCSKKVSIYGIIQSYDAKQKTLTLMDETRKYFQLIVNVMMNPDNPASARVPMCTGNIIRITNLRLIVDYSRRCYEPGNLVTFESFRNERFRPKYVAERPQLTEADRNRVDELIRYNVQYILESEIRPTRSPLHHIVDAGFQILCSQVCENRVILACYNGKPFVDFPCIPLIKLQRIIDMLNNTGKGHCYSENFIRQIYEDGKILFVSVYGLHRTTALVLKPLEMIVLYNLLIKCDRFNYGKYCFLIYDGYSFGRCIRTVDENCELAINLETQIEESCLLNESSISQFNQTPSQIMSHSQIFNTPDTENRDAKRPKLDMRSPSNLLANTLNESALNAIVDLDKVPCSHFQYDLCERKLIHRNFYSNRDKSFTNAIRCRTINEIVQQANTSTDQLFQIRARFHSLVLEESANLFKSMSNLRRYGTVVLCTSGSTVRTCPYRETYETFLDQSRDLYKELNGRLVMVADEDVSMDRLRCPCCSLQTCILCLDFTIILKDYDGGLMLVRWTDLDANLFFLCTTVDLCQGEGSNILKTISAIFKHMSHISNDQSECINKLTWTLVIENSSEQEDKREFRLVDVSILNKSKACGIQT